jgi:two-component system nitrate/nitrite response regulator NarL
MLDVIRVAIIGPNEIVREGLRCILSEKDFEVRAGASSVEDLVPLVSSDEPPHILVLNGFPEDTMLNASRDARDAYPLTRVVVILERFDSETVIRCVGAGIDGVLVRDISCEQLAGALKLIALGQRMVPSEIVGSLTDLHWRRTSGDWEATRASVNLSDREIEILKCLVAGEANKVISRRLNITEATVKVHIKAILRKLHVVNRTQAAIWAVVRGLNRIAAVPEFRGHDDSSSVLGA